MTRAYTIECNGEQVYFDADAFDAGELKLVEETSDEQCEDCGTDISQASAVEGPVVVCDCGTYYDAMEINL